MEKAGDALNNDKLEQKGRAKNEGGEYGSGSNNY